jgi:hypothetical protein
MKVTVNRQLNSGQYIVRFQVSDFSPEELAKMNSFGIPVIQMVQLVQGGGRRTMALPINQISSNIIASFGTEEEATKYQDTVLTQISQAMKTLRERKDNFTSTQEVDI